jgi:chorismate synthase
MSEVTKQDLQNVVEELKKYIDQRSEDLQKYIDHRSEDLQKHIDQRSEKVETNLLSAFHGWARSMEIRVRNSGSMVTGFDERLALAEERISELERRKPQSQA